MPDRDSFALLIAAAQAGSESAWAELFRSLVGPVTGYLQSRGASEPDDLAGQVFLELARDIHRFHGDEAAFRSWVFVIAHRRLIDERRARQRRPSIAGLPGNLEERLPGGDVEAEALEWIRRSDLRELFDSLSPDQGDVLALRIIGGLTLEETAQALGKRVGAIKALQRRGLEALRRRMAREGVTL